MQRKGRVKKTVCCSKTSLLDKAEDEELRKQLWIQANREELKKLQALTYRTVTQQIDQNAKSLWNMAFLYLKKKWFALMNYFL